MLRKFSFLVLLIVLASALFAQEKNYPDNWEQISTKNFQVWYPKSWRKSTDGEANSQLILVCPDVLDYNPFKENITLYVQNLSSFPVEFNLSTYAEMVKGELYSLYPDISILEAKKKVHNGREYYELLYTFSREVYKLKSYQYFWVIGDYAYSFAYMGNVEDYDKFYPAAYKIMQSFELREQD